MRDLLLPYFSLAKNLTASTGVKPELVLAIIYQESRGEPLCSRYEPLFKWLHEPDYYSKKLRQSLDTEIIHQKTSFGLGQIMLATARWLGFADYGPLLYQPVENIRVIVKYLTYLTNKYLRIPDVISSYNQGTPKKDPLDDSRYANQDYVDRVIGYMREIEKWKI